MTPILQSPERVWECPSCGTRHRDHAPVGKVPAHQCRALNGLVAPFVEITHKPLDPMAVRHVPVLREDYDGEDRGLVRNEKGQTVSSVRTERRDGSNDVHIFAPVAVADAKEFR